MLEKSLIENARDYIAEKMMLTQRKYESIYSTITDQKKKESILKSINEIESDMQKLQSGRFNEDDIVKYRITVDELKDYADSKHGQDLSKYKILRNIPMIRLNDLSKSRDINLIWAFLNYFGSEYMGLLSEQNLKLDYSHAYQRDNFFTQFNQIIRLIEDYGNVLEQIVVAETNKNMDYRERLVKVQNKDYRDIIIKTGHFMFSIQDFILNIEKCEENGEKVFMEPDRIVEIKGYNSMLEGLKAKEALADLLEFAKEVITYIKFPDLRKIEE
jgi:hypothetical protein